MSNRIVWCDIPVVELARAERFYAAVLAVETKRTFPDMEFAILEYGNGELAGCISKMEGRPGTDGPLVYFDCNGRLADAVAQVEPHGGKVLVPPHAIGPYGFRAVVLDSEGNRVALHSQS